MEYRNFIFLLFFITIASGSVNLAYSEKNLTSNYSILYGLELQIMPEPEPTQTTNSNFLDKIVNNKIMTSILDNPENTGEIIFRYLNNLINDIAKDSSLFDVFAFSIGMVIYGIFIFHFYRFLAKRDMLSLNLAERIKNRKLKSTGETITLVPRTIGFVLANFIIYPIVIFVWFLIYSILLFILVSDAAFSTIFLASSSLIIAIRMAAYYDEDLSKDFAKLLPFALLAIFLFNPTFFDINEVIEKLVEIGLFLKNILAFLFLAVILEIVLSTMYLIKVKFFHKEMKFKGTDSEHPI